MVSDAESVFKRIGPEIKAVIFDLGGVVIEWTDDIVYNYISDRFGLDFEDVKEKLEALLYPPLDKGEIDEREFWTKFFNYYSRPLPTDWKDLWVEKFREKAELNVEVIELIKNLKTNLETIYHRKQELAPTVLACGQCPF